MKRALLILVVTACGPAEELETGLAVAAPERPMQQPPPQQQPALTGLPCDVRDVMQAACARCHMGSPPNIPAFRTRTEMIAMSEKIAGRVSGTTGAPMPPRLESRQLSAAERTLLLDWIAQGLPAGACGDLQ